MCQPTRVEPAQRVRTLLAAIERDGLDPTTIALAPVAAALLDATRADGGSVVELADAAAALARLLEYKSAALVPRPTVTPPPEPDEPPPDLSALAEQYRQFQAAVDALRARDRDGVRSFPRLAPPPVPVPSTGLDNVSLEQLVAAVQAALQRRPPEPPGLLRYTVTVQERLAALEAELRVCGRINFHRFIAACHSRLEIIVGFLAVLELIKRGQAFAEQPEPFGDIMIVAVAATPAALH